MAYSKRTLVYASPANDPRKIFDNLVNSDKAVSIPIDENVNYIAKQIKFEISDYHELNKDDINEVFDQLKKFDVSINCLNDFENIFNNEGYLNDWSIWMNKGLSINTAPQTAKTWSDYKNLSESAKESFLNFFHLLSFETKEMIFFNQWFSYNDPRFNKIDKNLMKRILKLFIINDESVLNDKDIDGLELILNENKLTLYLYYYYYNDSDNGKVNHLLIDKLANNKAINQEFAILTEMEPVNSETSLKTDRFVQGVRSNSNSGKNQDLIPTMLVMSPRDYVLSNYKISMKFSDFAAAMHPKIEFQFTPNVDAIETSEEAVKSSAEETNFNIWDVYPKDLSYDQCKLYIESTFSNEFIIDKWELERSIGKHETCISKIENISNGGMDLELPVYKINEWGSIVKLEIDNKCLMNDEYKNKGQFSIPVHLRYGEPFTPEKHAHPHTSFSESSGVTIPSNKVYWECQMKDDESETVRGSFLEEEGRFTLGSHSQPKGGAEIAEAEAEAEAEADETDNTRRFYFPVELNDTVSALNAGVRLPSVEVQFAETVEAGGAVNVEIAGISSEITNVAVAAGFFGVAWLSIQQARKRGSYF